MAREQHVHERLDAILFPRRALAQELGDEALELRRFHAAAARARGGDAIANLEGDQAETSRALSFATL